MHEPKHTSRLTSLAATCPQSLMGDTNRSNPRTNRPSAIEAKKRHTGVSVGPSEGELEGDLRLLDW